MNAMRYLRQVAAENSSRTLALLAIVTAMCIGACSGSKEEQGEELLRAVANGQSDRVQALLEESGVDPNTLVGPKGMHALFIASGSGNARIVRMLLENGAEPDLKTGQGFSALGISSTYGHTEVIEILLDHGADVNRNFGPDGSWGTALHYAAADGHEDAVRLLLRRGGDPSITDGDNRRPIDRAATRGVRNALRNYQEETEKGFRMAEEFINSTCADLTRRYNGSEKDKAEAMMVLGAAGYQFAAALREYVPDCAGASYKGEAAFSDGMIAYCAEHPNEDMRTALSTFACGSRTSSR
jgi:ankyrin repeat protein